MQVSVVSIALDKLIEQPLPNLKLLHVDGSALTEYFADSEVDQIYLNFPIHGQNVMKNGD